MEAEWYRSRPMRRMPTLHMMMRTVVNFNMMRFSLSSMEILKLLYVKVMVKVMVGNIILCTTQSPSFQPGPE